MKPENQKLVYNGKHLENDEQKLSEFGLTAETAGVLQPAILTLSVKIGKFFYLFYFKS